MSRTPGTTGFRSSSGFPDSSLPNGAVRPRPFRSVAETLKTIARDPKRLGAEIGFLAILHTWGQTLHHHAHIHCVIPGGGLSPDSQRWIPCRNNFFLPVRVLSSLFKKRFLSYLKEAVHQRKLSFHGELKGLEDPNHWKRFLHPLYNSKWVVYAKPPERLHGLVPASFETYQIVQPGDIIVRPTDLQNDWNSLRFGLSRHRGIITSAYMCLRTHDVMSREYGHFLLHTYDLKKVFYGLGSGLRQNLDWRDFKYLPCFLPAADEQSAIVRFLDAEIRRFNEATDHAQREISLLREYCTRLVADVVTGKVDVRHLASEGIESSAEDLEPLEESDDVREDELQGTEDMEPSEEMDNADD